MRRAKKVQAVPIHNKRKKEEKRKSSKNAFESLSSKRNYFYTEYAERTVISEAPKITAALPPTFFPLVNAIFRRQQKNKGDFYPNSTRQQSPSSFSLSFFTVSLKKKNTKFEYSFNDS